MLIMNNCHNRPHSEIFGRYDAFFDLDRSIHGPALALLYDNAICCVLSYKNKRDNSGDIVAALWRYKQYFEHDGENMWVLVGEAIGSFACSKAEMAKNPELGRMFTVDGDFKQISVLSTG